LKFAGAPRGHELDDTIANRKGKHEQTVVACATRSGRGSSALPARSNEREKRMLRLRFIAMRHTHTRARTHIRVIHRGEAKLQWRRHRDQTGQRPQSAYKVAVVQIVARGNGGVGPRNRIKWPPTRATRSALLPLRGRELVRK
jgi:hypothetical protein